MSWLRSLIIASRHRKDALETAGVSARAGVHTVPDRRLHVPGVMFMFMFTFMFTFICMCLSIVMGSCRVMSAEVNGPAINTRWDGMSIGMHCAAVSTHLRQDGIGRKTSESIIHQQQAFQPAPALSSSDLARPRSDHATSNLGNGSFGTQGQSYAFCPPQPTWGRLVDKTHPARPLPSTMTSSFPPRRSRAPIKAYSTRGKEATERVTTPPPDGGQAPRHQSEHAGLNLLLLLSLCRPVFPQSRNPSGVSQGENISLG